MQLHSTPRLQRALYSAGFDLGDPQSVTPSLLALALHLLVESFSCLCICVQQQAPLHIFLLFALDRVYVLQDDPNQTNSGETGRVSACGNRRSRGRRLTALNTVFTLCVCVGHCCTCGTHFKMNRLCQHGNSTLPQRNVCVGVGVGVSAGVWVCGCGLWLSASSYKFQPTCQVGASTLSFPAF